jgi:hypothetical protein
VSRPAAKHFAEGGGANAGAFAFSPRHGQTESGSSPRSAKGERSALSFVSGFTPIKRGGSVAPSGPPRQFWVKVNN